MCRIGDETLLLSHEIDDSFKQTVDRMHKRKYFIRNVLIGKRTGLFRRLFIQMICKLSNRCQFTANNVHYQPSHYRQKE